MKNYLLAHGFCFNNSYWKNLIGLLNGNVYYYDDNFLDTDNKEYIGIGHSLGFLKLNNSGLKFSHLISVQGFLNFCGDDPKTKKIREYNLEKMIQNFQNNPTDALKNFYKSCGWSENEMPFKNVPNNFLEDLKMMKNKYLHCGIKTTAIATKGDKIVPQIITEDNFSGLKNVIIKYYLDDNIIHTLGFDKSEAIIDAINEITN